MKQLVLITFLIILCFAGETHSQQRNIRDTKMGDTVLLYDWNRDGVLDTFLIKDRERGKYDNNYIVYKNLDVNMSNGSHFSLGANTKQIEYGINSDESLAINKILVEKSVYFNKYLWLMSISDKIKFPFLFLTSFSIEGGENLPTLIILGLDDRQRPRIQFIKPNLSVFDLIDIDNDGNKDIAAIQCISQNTSQFIYSYNPYAVYSFTNGQFHYNELLSKSYFNQYFDSWKGKNCSDDWVIIDHPKLKKPKVMKLDDAIKLEKKLNKGRKEEEKGDE